MQTVPDVQNAARLAGAACNLSEGEFRRILEHLPEAAYTCDADGLITYFNRQAEVTWGRAPSLHDPADRWCGSFKLFSAKDGSPISHDDCWMARALKHNREYYGCQIIIEQPSGRRLTALAHASPIHDAQGNIIGAINMLVDITERVAIEKAKEQAAAAKDQFLAILSHELRNPLAPIRQAIDYLRSDAATEEDRRWAYDILDRQTSHMQRLMDDLLDISRISRNKLELHATKTTLAAIIAASLEISRPYIKQRGHEIFMNLAPESVPLEGDAVRLAQAISNLLNNAAKFTPSGGRIYLRSERQGSDAVITVEDTGLGIAPQSLEAIFGMFVQLGPGKHGGMGIGLALARSIAELHGGSLRAESDGTGKGARFVMRLPVILTPAAPIPAPPAAQARQTRSLRVLIADDNGDCLDTLQRVVARAGHIVQIARDGQEAVDIAQTFQPEVAILDIGMPRLNGYEAARAIRQTPFGKNALLIAATGWGQDGDRQLSQQSGFNEHLVKPVNTSKLLALLHAACPSSAT